jgi:hypothetical protein
MHRFPGVDGVCLGFAIPAGLWLLFFFTKSAQIYSFDLVDAPGSFEPYLAKYLKIAETIIGLASGSIVLLVGSFAIHGQAGGLSSSYASSLFMFVFTVLYGLIYSVWIVRRYEDSQHEGGLTRSNYAICETLGFLALFCFVAGYVWLILSITSR